jgi:prevent-host-death family protein
MTIVSIKEARANISQLVDKAEQGEQIIVTRNGRKVAVIHGFPSRGQKLPPQGDFRATIKCHGSPLSTTVMENRAKERF